VNCAGRWTNEATRDAGLHLPLAPTVGFLVFTPPVAASLSRVVRTTVIDARPDGAGRLLLHWNPTDAKVSFDTKLNPSMPEARDLVRRARQLLPSIGEVEPEAVRIAIRPIPGDQLSAIGPMPRTSGYYIAITHSGVTMSPFLGAVVADEILRGRQRAELAHFRPASTDLETLTAGVAKATFPRHPNARCGVGREACALLFARLFARGSRVRTLCPW
jgi:glycine/D-amino acid oxidase-like deaminating enzyme